MRTHGILEIASRSGVRLGLQRVRQFLGALGDPQLAVPVVHVAGTNGKGSVCHMLSRILSVGGHNVGLTISPHIQDVNERIQINGQPISDLDLAALLERVDRLGREWAMDRLSEPLTEESPLTYFELMAVAAFLHFAAVKPDVAVVEVGLGGRLDATNVVRPEVAVITSIGLDHCDQLGPDLASVAGEKAGIIKPGVPVVTGPLPPEALRVVRQMAREHGSALHVLGEDFKVRGEPGNFRFSSPDHELSDLEVALHGQHQVENAAVALRAAELLAHRIPSLGVGEGALRSALRHVRNPGRLEWLGPDLLVDGAHNAMGAERLADYLAGLPRDRPRTLLLGCSQDKDVRAIAAPLSHQVDRIFTTRCAHPRAMSPGQVAEALVGLRVPVMPAGPIEEALPMARESDGTVVVAGSLFLAGAARDLSPES